MKESLNTIAAIVSAVVAVAAMVIAYRASVIDEAKEMEQFRSKLATLENEMSTLQSKPPQQPSLINRCRIVTAVNRSSGNYFGAGSIARCDRGEVVLGGACGVSTPTCGTISQIKDNYYECVLPTKCGISVQAQAVCCK